MPSLLGNKCTKDFNLLHVVAHTLSVADQLTILHLCRSLIRSILDYSSVIYGSACGFYLQIMDPIQNQALHLSLGAYRNSHPPAFVYLQMNDLSICVGEKTIQCSLKLSSSTQNLTYSTLFEPNF